MGSDSCRAGAQLLVRCVADVVEHDLEARDVLSHARDLQDLLVEQLVEALSHGPAGFAVMQDDGDDDRGRQLAAVLKVLIEHVHHVAADLDQRAGLGVALVLEHDVEPRVAAGYLHAE